MTSPAGDRLGLGSDRITWERFEQFCLALLNDLPEVESATRYAVPGEHQEGIDIEVHFADGSTGGVQCRQRAKFGKPDFDKAVSDNEYEATRNIVVTTGPATVPARKAEREAPGWEIWDIDDIGVNVRERLPRVDARWLVEDHLGAAERRAFLGPDGPLTVARWDRHFAPLLRPNRLFSHTAGAGVSDLGQGGTGVCIAHPTPSRQSSAGWARATHRMTGAGPQSLDPLLIFFRRRKNPCPDRS
jgi:Restriction endonuclease